MCIVLHSQKYRCIYQSYHIYDQHNVLRKLLPELISVLKKIYTLILETKWKVYWAYKIHLFATGNKKSAHYSEMLSVEHSLHSKQTEG